MPLGVKQLIIVGDLVKEIFRVQAILSSRKFKNNRMFNFKKVVLLVVGHAHFLIWIYCNLYSLDWLAVSLCRVGIHARYGGSVITYRRMVQIQITKLPNLFTNFN